jgi:hypothetical protein
MVHVPVDPRLSNNVVDMVHHVGVLDYLDSTLIISRHSLSSIYARITKSTLIDLYSMYVLHHNYPLISISTGPMLILMHVDARYACRDSCGSYSFLGT